MKPHDTAILIVRSKTGRRLVVGAIVCALLCTGVSTAGKIRGDLIYDIQNGTSFASRWYPLTYPLLTVWRHAHNETRRRYATKVLLGAAWPSGEAFLEDELRRNPPEAFPLGQLRDDIVASLHLNDTAIRNSCLEAALAGLRTGGVGSQFNVGFLTAMLGSSVGKESLDYLTEMALKSGPSRAQVIVKVLCWAGHGDDPRIYRWVRQIERPADYYKEPADSPAQMLLLAAEANSKLRPCIVDLANHDLSQLCTLDDLHLQEVVKWFPHSHLAQGCRDYAAIRGKPYFRIENRGILDPQLPIRRPYTPAVESRLWQQWIRRYPGHPGTDDAMYWMARCLEWQGRRTEAFWQYVDLIKQHAGDQDAKRPSWVRLTMLMDVAATDNDIDQLQSQRVSDPVHVALRYVLAVRRARSSHFVEAAKLTQGMSVNDVMQSWYSIGGKTWKPVSWMGDYLETVVTSDRLTDQRHLWQAFQACTPADTSERRLRLARAWAQQDAWKASYLVLWEEGKAYHYAYDQFSNDVPYSRVMAPGYRHANASCIALEWLHPILADARVAGSRREEALYLEYQLLGDVRWYPDPEATAIAPIPGYPVVTVKVNPPGDYDSAPDWYSLEQDIDARILAAEFPDSKYVRYIADGRGSAARTGVSWMSDLKTLWTDYGDSDETY